MASISPTPQTTPTSNGLVRTPAMRSSTAPMSARAAARKPAIRGNSGSSGPSKATDSSYDDDSRAEHAQLVEELRQQVQKAEIASEQYQKELEILQMRLDEAVGERNILEDQVSQKDTEAEAVHAETKDIMRQKKELEQAHNTEKAMMLKEREERVNREQELQGIIKRLNETIRQKEMRTYVDGDRPVMSRSGIYALITTQDYQLIESPASFRSRASPDLDPGQFAPSAQLERSPSRNNSKLLLQKDKMIESLRLELAEVQIKVAEIEHLGDGRLQEIEKQLLDTRMANARLMEDNESFQLLLSEKTLKGDFTTESRPETAAGMGTLADELEFAGDGGEGERSEAYKKLEAELKSCRDSNKALTLYIDKIIGRLLQHEGFEHIILGNDEQPKIPTKLTDKALPPPPPGEQGPSFLQRARSVVAGKTGRPPPKPRPMSYMPSTTAEVAPTAHENPETAPSIPLTRGHRRSRSDQATENPVAAAIVGQMRRGSPLRTSSGGPTSPGISPSMSPSMSSNRSPFILSGNPPNSRVTSGSGPPTGERSSRTNSMLSEHSGEVNSQDTASPPREKQGPNALPGAVMKQNQLRPLRLVRENTLLEDDEAARKKANRGSWMPTWFNRAGGVENEPMKPPT